MLAERLGQQAIRDMRPANGTLNLIYQQLSENLWLPRFGVNHGGRKSDRDRASHEEQFKAELDARVSSPVLLEEGRREGNCWPYQTLSKVVAATRIV